MHHLKTKHNIHPGTGSPLHYSHDENVLNTLGFVGKDGREIFGMPIPDALLTNDIKGAHYYDEYMEHVAKYQQHLDAEHGMEDEGDATESPKATKVTKPKATKVTKPADDKAPKPTSSQPPKSTPAQTKPSKKDQVKKHKMVKETSEAPSPAKRAKAGVPEKEPVHDDEEADLQRALDLSLKDQEERTQGPARPVRRTPMPTESSGHAESPSLDAELALTDSEMESDKEAPQIRAGDQDDGQAGPNLGIQDEGQAGPNPFKQDEGQAGSNPGDAAESQPQSSYVVHAGPNLEHMDSEAIDASTQQETKQMDEEFTTTAYPNVQENLKLPTKDQVIIEEPASSTGTLSSLQNFAKELSLTNQFFDTLSVPPMTSPVIDLTVSHPVSIMIHALLPTSTATARATTTTTSLPPPPPQPQQSTTDPILVRRIVSKAVDEIVTDAVDWAMQAPLRACLSHEDHKNLYDALQKSLERDYSNQLLADLDEARKKKRKIHESPRTPPGSPHSQPPPPIGASGAPDVKNNRASALVSTYETSAEPPAENSLLAKIRDMTTFMNWYSQKVNKIVLTQADFEGQACEVVKAFYPDVIQLQFQMEECHKMLTDQVDWTNPEGDQTKYLRYGRKGSSPALSISKMKAASYPDIGLELLVPEQMWIDDVCTDDISAKYGISHWWFNRQKFYIDRHDSTSHRKEVRTHMRILSVVRIKAYSRYRYDYWSEIVLRRADFQEHTIAEKYFKNLYPSDFEDLNLLLLQGHLDYLSGSNKRMLSTAVKLWTRNLVIRQRVKDFQLGIESYQTQLNLTKPRWDATGYEFKHDYTIIESPRAVVFPVDNNDQKIMRFNEIYKFSDGMLTRILEALDYKVKEFKVKQLNLGMNTQFWTQKDVTRSKEFITAIERRLKTRRIYQNLECFVGGRVRDIDYRLLQRTE
ncbi:retrovirus-related pol polyprotein from transposon TNT 1-94 [Tanacetum coccineum]|uniref:Retrovirus-related pol polyprotein from transposon TNT 1-94 n=1 Tax=Tanacetum coccineum TaxID=301880 RepID=A0ABQ4ZKZ8_9ASTR